MSIIMMKIFLINTLLLIISNLRCGKEEIEHCVQCGIGEDSDSCSQCENKYFLFFNNLFCLPCDHEYYGNIGCGGNCDGSKYKEIGNILCEENKCKEGYYNLEGICIKCSIGSEYCEKCTYIAPYQSNIKEFKCIKCINNEYQVLDDGRCHHCSIANCNKCHYPSSSKTPVCDECKYNYYVNSKGNCSECYKIGINKGYCNICSDDNQNYKSGKCYCNYTYTLIPPSTCTSCPENCGNCNYNESTKQIKCISCKSGYSLNSENKCVKCGSNCDSCNFDTLQNQICKRCFLGYTLNEKKICIKCPDNCSNCKINENNTIECTSCFLFYGLDLQKKCVKCPTDCKNCYYRKNENDFGCSFCGNEKNYSYYNSNYTIGKNEKCYLCKSISEIGGNGCESCTYNKKIDRFECKRCVSNKYIMISNDKSCKLPKDIGLSDYCEEGINLGTLKSPIYSCIKCQINTVKVTNQKNITNCMNRENNLINCLEAIQDSNNKYQCTKCVSNFPFIYSNVYNQNICDSKCESDSFFKYNYCYKCNDINYGMIGCNAVKGCDYKSSNDQLNCNECDKGYFKYTYGQCFSCQKEDKLCVECHINNETSKYECDKCIEGYMINDKTKQCEPITCDEYPEISPGCYICKDKINEYKLKNKCQMCGLGYFKTKNESCVFCKSKKNGGPACDICEYKKDENGKELDEIKCKYCSSNNILSTNGKCYNCKDELGQACQKCNFTKKEDNFNEELYCLECSQNYNLNSDGYCISYKSYYQKLPQCSTYSYEISKINKNICTKHIFDIYNSSEPNFDYFDYYDDYYSYNNRKVCTTVRGIIICLDNYYNNYCIEEIPNKEYSSKNNFIIKTKCLQCKKGYFKDNNGNCEGLSFETCSYIFALESNQKYLGCKNFCNSENFAMINYTMNKTQSNGKENEDKNNKTKNEDIISINIDYILKNYGYNSFDSLDEELKDITIKGQLCISNSGKKEKNLKKCKKAEFINNEYRCIECIDGYFLDKVTQKCTINTLSKINNCELENIGTSSYPIYSCKKCYNSSYIFMYKEKDVRVCVEPKDELEGCKEAYANTTYINDIYNCNNCSMNYLSYYSLFFNRKICQNIYQDIIKRKELTNNAFDEIESVLAKNGRCENNRLFTPDGINCYSCNNKVVGMVGCKGACSFSLERNNVIECEEGGCKTGYLESNKGICESCNTINKGCIECHVEDENEYKKNNKFVCDECEEGYLKSDDGRCHHCSEIGFTHCKKCKKDIEDENNLICVQCSEDYFLTNEGYCTKCNNSQVQTIRNTCVFCDDVDEGGIEGCKNCYNNGGKILCKECTDGFILLENNQTCLKISENEGLEKYINCQQLSLTNNILECTKCIQNYVLLKEGKNIKCVNYTFIPSYNYNSNKLCQESINYGTEENPIFSCNKCIDNNYIEESERIKGKIITKIVNLNNNKSFCDYSTSYTQLENCTEAIVYTIEGINRYNCTKCTINNTLKYNSDIDYNICQYIHYERNCMVKYCKTCQEDNNYFCSSCLPVDYEVNPVTGSCVKKTDKIPAITWKDIFRLEMNKEKEINGQRIKGPSLILRGLTNSQINTGHAFLIYLIFKLKNLRNNRNLEEQIKVPTICEIIDSVDETNNEVNIVEYNCIGNATEKNNLNEYILDNIEQDDNNGILETNNLDEVISETDLSDLENKKKSIYTIENLVKEIIFEMDKIENQTFNNYTFNFSVQGKINKELKPSTIEGSIELSEIKNKKADCIFEIKENSKADLNCELNIEKYKEYKSLSFKVSEIGNKDNKIYLSKINEIFLINKIEGDLYNEKEINKNENTEKEEDINENENKNQNKKRAIIIIVVILSIICTILIILITFCIIKRCKIKNRLKENEKRNNRYLGNIGGSSTTRKRIKNNDPDIKTNPNYQNIKINNFN